MDFKELTERRYSCRKISDKKVPEELIEKIISVGLNAPTAVNYQPFRIFLMDSDEAKENIKKVTNFTFGADVFIVVGCKKDEAWVREFDGKNFGEVDASIVATQIMLEIVDLGLDSTWVGHFDAPKLKELCPEMKDLELIAIFPIGYAREDARPAKLHTLTKPKEELFKKL